MAEKKRRERYKLSPEMRERRKELVTKAIGNMSIPMFAEKSGITRSVIYRILDGTTEAPCSHEAIEAIAANAAKESGVTLDMLREVNGYEVNSQVIPLDEAQGRLIIREKISELAGGFDVEITDSDYSDELFADRLLRPDIDYVVSLNDAKWFLDDERMMMRLVKYMGSLVNREMELNVYKQAVLGCIAMAQADESGNSYSLLMDYSDDYYDELGRMLRSLRLKNRVSIVFVEIKAISIIKMREICCLDMDGNPYEELLNYDRE